MLVSIIVPAGKQSAPLPVILPPIPVDSIPPISLSSFQSDTLPLVLDIFTPNSSFPNSLSLSLFNRPKPFANASLYPVVITDLYGFLPKK